MTPAYRLWLEGKVQLSEFTNLTIDDVEDGNRALDAWVAASGRGKR